MTGHTERPCLDHGRSGKSEGYAAISCPLGRIKIHRWVFFQEHGYLPPVVMHKCDNPRCIEPSHLTAGDRDANNKDRAAKGRSAKNVHSRRRLTAGQAVEIRERFARRTRGKDPINGVRALAREFGVDTTVIYDVAEGRTYRDVA